MNRYSKAAVAIAAALVLCFALIGCSLVSVNSDKDNAQVVAKVGDMTVTKGDYKDAFNQMPFLLLVLRAGPHLQRGAAPKLPG